MNTPRPRWALGILAMSTLTFLGSSSPWFRQTMVQLLSLGLAISASLWWSFAPLVLPKLPSHRRQLFPIRILLLFPLLGLTAFRFGGIAGFVGFWAFMSALAAWGAYSLQQEKYLRYGFGTTTLVLLIFLILASLTSGCAYRTAINLQYHDFGLMPNRIVWLQIPGLSAEHLAMIRFNSVNSTVPLSLEKFLCHGQMWSYNLYSLRPSPNEGMLGQIFGTKNINGDAYPVDRYPFWHFLRTTDQQKFKVGIFEKGVNAEDSLAIWSTQEKGKVSFQDLYFWLMRKAPEANTHINYFHQMNTNYHKKPGIYYDQSCQQQPECFSSQYNNFLAIFEKFSKNEDYYVFILRNFDYSKKLQGKKYAAAREELMEIIQTIDFLYQLSERFLDLLVVVSSSAALPMEFPDAGKEWELFATKTKGSNLFRTSLMAPIWAHGAKAENFCGMYEEDDVHRRFLYRPPRNILEKWMNN